MFQVLQKMNNKIKLIATNFITYFMNIITD